MSFNSIEFALFFAMVFAFYFMPAMRTSTRQNTLLLTVSYFFYSMWDWRFLILIIFTTTTTFLAGKHLVTNKSKWVAAINITINLGILILFKYFNFFGENFVRLLQTVGIETNWLVIDIILPVGISFYTFQAIGYTIDAYSGDFKDNPPITPLQFATFIAYFPQLVAGPIERAKNILPQLTQTRVWNYQDSLEGMRRILWGMMKKVVIADQCGIHADAIWTNGMDVPHGEIKMYVAVILFSIQIYCDFSGYCDIALGSSRMLGIRLMENFKKPYFSRSVLEFWHRWHISLMEWFQLYVYIPLGGSRVSKYRHYFNIIIVFLISGLWHGASYCFLLWGMYWALVYIIAIAMKIPSYKNDTTFLQQNILGTILTNGAVIIGWGIFRSTSISECIPLLCRSVVPLTAVTVVCCVAATFLLKRIAIRRAALFIMTIVVIAVCILFNNIVISHYYLAIAVWMFLCEYATCDTEEHLYPLPCNKIMRRALYIIIYISILTAASSDTAFIYFQF